MEERIRLQAIFESAVDGIITIDQKSIIDSVNPAASRLFGYEENELVGKKVTVLMPEPHHTDHDSYISNYLQTGEAKIIGIGREVNGLRKDGVQFPFRLSVGEMKIGENSMFTAVIHDLTELKLNQAKLNKYAKELEQNKAELEGRVTERTQELERAVNALEKANKGLRDAEDELRNTLSREMELNQMKGRFVTLASHEFRTPLATILSSASLISRYNKEEDAEKREKHVSRIKNTVTALNSILNEFLSISRLEEGRVNISVSSFYLNEFASEIDEEMSVVLKPGQVIYSKLEADSLLDIVTDRQILKAIAVNLISNAIKYSMEYSPIRCTWKATMDHIHLEIEDNGIGIPEADQPHLFERFFRAHNASHIQGTGLGLNIVKRYIELLGGTITYKSLPEAGSTFFVEIPNIQK
jgi:two-component system, LuxR family, sensor kinase FixL